MKKSVLLIFTVLLFSHAASADTFTLTFTSTVETASTSYLPDGVSEGDSIEIFVDVDNGGSTNQDQAWGYSDILSVSFSVNGGSYTGDFGTLFTPLSMDGYIETESTGAVRSVTADWQAQVGPGNLDSNGDDLAGFRITRGNDIIYTAQGFSSVGAKDSMHTAGKWTVSAGTPTPQEPKICLDGDTVIGIKGLEVLTDQYGTINIDVDFRYTTGFDVYGSSLNNFPFDTANAEEDAFAAMLAINNVLDINPVPGSAGQPGQTAYFIGAEQESEGGEGLIAAVGSENLTGSYWDPCTRANDCFLGTTILEADQRSTYADLSRAVAGASCDTSAPPPSTFTITPGISGSWYDPARDGEGYNIEIIGSSLDPVMLAYFYTYDDAGNQMWLTASGPFEGDTATLPALVTSGAVFGPGFDSDDVDYEDWGTLTFRFTSCNEGTATYNSTIGFGTGTANIVRLSSVIGLACP